MGKSKQAQRPAVEDIGNDYDISTFIPTPPDGGWGWVIVLASFVSNFIVDGICYTFGIFLLEFSQAFDESKSKISLVGSLQAGMYLCAGPIVSALTNRFGCRPVTIVGSMIAGGAFLLATLSPSVDMLLVTYGLLGGFGFGMMYLPAIVSVGFYFDRRRAMATGIAVCGSGVGTFVFAPLSKYLLDIYDWKNALLILAGIVLNGIVCGALMRPLKPGVDKKKGGSGVAYSSVPNIVITRVDQTVDDINSSACVETLTTGDKTESDQLVQVPCVNMEDKVHRNALELPNANRTFISDANIHKLKDELARPMYRKDLFYSGSIMHIPQYRSQQDMKTYIKSVTSIPGDMLDDESYHFIRCKCIPNSARDALEQMLNFSVLKNVPFLFICFGNILSMIGFYVPFVYIADKAVGLEIAPQKAAFLLSIIGITNTVGRILAGCLADFMKGRSLLINNISMLLCGISTLLCPFCDTYITLCIYTAVFGLCVGVYISLSSIILCDLLGLEHLTSAFGLLTLARGLSSCAGPPIAGAVYEMTQSLNPSFYLSGAMITAGAVCHFILMMPCMRRFAPERNTEVADE
ncbi:hypothetical protein LOTGIDRAFT_212648 [Lottia gigantea]|uniref:Major facilitator superfamily (MFS) profile domain-containing protein n=1 Tax=Lottia gigantea TaxID=225164 RepID=V4B8E1_LOTGI|nr:hypothetical protein LOTGIDRAFT_212648 [Lottia gigantea]ESP02002.1 hypothetical protein LOTGIDRAFT_212648 [Lottia gigantea]